MDLSYLGADTSVPLVDQTLGDLLTETATAHPERLALVGRSHDGDEVRLTYAELLLEAQRAATGIAGLAEPGDFVALWAPNVAEWPIIEYGAALAGVVLVCLNPVLREAELDYVLRHSHARVLLYAERSRDYEMAPIATGVAASLGLTAVSLADRERWYAAEPDPAVLEAAPHDANLPAMLQYTSGTTGNPKGVLLRHRSIVNVARLTMDFCDVPRGAVAVNPLPMFHTAACVIGTLGPLCLGGAAVLIEQFAPDVVLDVMQREDARVLFHVPAVLGALIQVQRARGGDAPHLDVVLGGAATVPPEMREAAKELFGASVVTVFGQTELAPVLTATRAIDSRDDQLTTVGHPLPQVEVKIVDPASGSVVPLGQVGEICARGYQQLVEYVHDPAATAATVDTDGFVHTGDLGSMDGRGYISLAGRLKEIIIRGGENISPAEIELCLGALEGVAEVAVVGVPDERLGEIVAAVVRTDSSLGDDKVVALIDRLRAEARAKLAPFKVPSRWFVADALPTTPTGKVRKFAVTGSITGGSMREIHPTP